MTDTRRIDPGEQFIALGHKVEVQVVLETFPNPGVSIVRMTSDEVTSLCPITGQPDFEVVDITYAPREKCIESKSLKLYLASLRNVGAFVESLAREIATLVEDTVQPYWVRVDVTQKPRGGISIVAQAVLYRDEEGTYDVHPTPPHNPYRGN